MQTLTIPCEYRDLPNGDIEVRAHGSTALLSRAQDGNAFVFHHDQIIDLHCRGLLMGFRLDGGGSLDSFQVGPLKFRVEDRHFGLDLYRAVLA